MFWIEIADASKEVLAGEIILDDNRSLLGHSIGDYSMLCDVKLHSQDVDKIYPTKISCNFTINMKNYIPNNVNMIYPIKSCKVL